MPSQPPSTRGHARSSAGAHQQKPSTSTYTHSNKQMLLRPVESAQYLSIRYSQRLDDNDIVASVGSKGDCLLTGQ